MIDLNLEPRQARIDLIPLIDVLFLLLIVFFYSLFSMVEQRGLPVDLARADSAKIQTEEFELLVIDRDGRFYLESSPAELPQIRSRLAGLESNKRVLIRADKNSPLHAGLSVLDIARSMGLKNITLETSPKAPSMKSSGDL
jgi:biopolymer transport protein ExbD